MRTPRQLCGKQTVRDETEAGSPVRRELRWQAKDHMASAGAVATKVAHKLLRINFCVFTNLLMKCNRHVQKSIRIMSACSSMKFYKQIHPCNERCAQEIELTHPLRIPFQVATPPPRVDTLLTFRLHFKSKADRICCWFG